MAIRKGKQDKYMKETFIKKISLSREETRVMEKAVDDTIENLKSKVDKSLEFINSKFEIMWVESS